MTPAAKTAIQGGIRMQDVKSSNITAMGYDPTSKTMAVKFTSGATYHYSDVPHETFLKVHGAESIGRAFGGLIRDKFKTAKVAG